MIFKYKKFLNELNKSTYLSAADKLSSYIEDESDDFETPEKLKRHATYMGIIDGNSPEDLKQILKDIEKWEKDYIKVMKDVDIEMAKKPKLHPRKQRKEFKQWKEDQGKKYMDMRKDIFEQKDELCERILKYYDITLGTIWKDDYNNKGILTQITASEIRFDNIDSIELFDLPYKIEEGEIVKTDEETIKNDDGYYIRKPKTIKIDPKILQKRKDIISYVKSISYLNCDDEGDFDLDHEHEDLNINDEVKYILFSTRRHGDVGSETYGQEDITEAQEVWKKLNSKFKNISGDIEYVDEWVHLNITIN